MNERNIPEFTKHELKKRIKAVFDDYRESDNDDIDTDIDRIVNAVMNLAESCNIIRPQGTMK